MISFTFEIAASLKLSGFASVVVGVAVGVVVVVAMPLSSRKLSGL